MAAKRKPTPYEAKTLELLADFDDAAKSWGWNQDSGFGPSAVRSEKEYNKAKAALTARINSLLRTRRTHSRKMK